MDKKEIRKQAQEEIFKILEEEQIKYCIEQNGMSVCKNCGLDVEELRKRVK